MWNEFEHVEDGRFDPNRDGYYGENRNRSYGYEEDDDDYDYDAYVLDQENKDRANFDEISKKLLDFKERLEEIFEEEQDYRDSLDEDEQWTEKGEISYDVQSSIEFSVEQIEKIVKILE